MTGNYSKEQQKLFHKRLQNYFASNSGGLVIIVNGDEELVTDTYNNIHKDCAKRLLQKIIKRADKDNLFLE